MNSRKTFINALALMLLLSLAVGVIQAQGPKPIPAVAPQAAAGTGFTYQGRLTDGGSPTTGTYDLRFILYNALVGGSQIGRTLSRNNVTVADGFFTVELDYGAGAFVGAARWLEISVRRGSETGDYTVLSPRQPISSVPYAVYALNTDVSGGVEVSSAAGDGVHIVEAGDDGVHVESTIGHGVRLDSVGNTGVYIYSVGRDGVHVESADDDGLHIEEAEDNAIQVDWADGDGIRISDAGERAGYFGGDVEVKGNLSKGAGGFKIDHPLNPEGQYLQHSFVESPDMMNVYNDNVTLDSSGEAWVELPSWFEALNKDFRYQLTAIGVPGPNLYIAQEVIENRFKIAGGEPGMTVSWQVTGIRHDPYARANRIPVEEPKTAEESGTYLHPEAYGLTPRADAGHTRSRELDVLGPGR